MASGTPVKTTLRDDELSRLDRFRREQKNPPTRGTAIRALIRKALSLSSLDQRRVMPVPLNKAPVGVISVVSAEIVIDQDDENKKSISVELPEAVKNEGYAPGWTCGGARGRGGPSEAGHSRMDAAIKGTRRLYGIEDLDIC